MKKGWPLLLVSMGFVHADVPPNGEVKESTAIPPKEVSVKNRYHLFATGDLLYWTARENGLEFVSKGIGPPGTNEKQIIQRDLVGPHFKWDLGFRAGLGYLIPHGKWDLYLNWTRYYTSNSRGEFNPSANPLHPPPLNTSIETLQKIWGTLDITGVIPTSLNEATAHWRLHLNLLDFEWGRNFFEGKWFAIRPYGGLRAAWIHQNYNVFYFAQSAPLPPFILTPPTLDESIQMRNNFFGIGPRGGFDARWLLGKEWSIYSNLALSLLYGLFKITEKDNVSGFDGFYPLNIHEKTRNNFRVGRLIGDLQLGLRWEHAFFRDRCQLQLQGGWEGHLFLGQNQLFRVAQPENQNFIFFTNQGDLSLQGWTFAAKLCF